MPILKIIKTSLGLLLRGNWRDFYVRSLVALGWIDLKTITIDRLNLSAEQSHSYSDSGWEHLQRVLSALEIGPEDAIVDFGCGKGGALIVLAAYPFARIAGVEISPELVAIARKNLARLKIDNVELVQGDARDFSALDAYNFVYFFNPFPCRVMAGVMVNLSASLTRQPRKITIIYLNPECHETITASGVFHKVKEFPHHAHVFSIYSNNS
jgi:SAM-dependent methyltransferase